jgi:hypothetical protein
LEGGPPIFRQDFTCPALLEDLSSGFPYGAVTRSGPPFQTLRVPKTEAIGLVRVRSPLLAESRLMSFPPATEMFQFAGFASPSYGFRRRYPPRSPLTGGLPHSETPGSPIARISPGLFAACYVLLRLSVPRHPPDALLLRSTTRPPQVSLGVPGPPPPAACPPQVREAAPKDGAYLLVKTLPLGTRPCPAPESARPGRAPRSRHFSLHNAQTANQNPVFPEPPDRDREASASLVISVLLISPPGGGDRDRTGALLRAKQALSQLSYTPVQGPGARNQDCSLAPGP